MHAKFSGERKRPYSIAKYESDHELILLKRNSTWKNAETELFDQIRETRERSLWSLSRERSTRTSSEPYGRLNMLKRKQRPKRRRWRSQRAKSYRSVGKERQRQERRRRQRRSHCRDTPTAQIPMVPFHLSTHGTGALQLGLYVPADHAFFRRPARHVVVRRRCIC